MMANIAPSSALVYKAGSACISRRSYSSDAVLLVNLGKLLAYRHFIRYCELSCNALILKGSPGTLAFQP